MTKTEFAKLVQGRVCFIKSTSEGEVSLVCEGEEPVHLYSGQYQEDEFPKYVRWLEEVSQ